MQRSAGNAAVSRMVAVQRHSCDEGCGHGKSAVPDVLRSPGRPLDSGLRDEMESRMGADFGDVRLHDDSTAQRSAAEVGAVAYTSGHHVVSGTSGIDKHTLAHELTHVLQQRQGPVAGTDRGDGMRISDPSDRFERAAEANARRVMAGESAVSGAHGGRAAANGERSPALQRIRADDRTREQTPDPRQTPSGREYDLTAHHLIPFNRLKDFERLVEGELGQKKTSALFGKTMPNWGDVTVDELIRINLLPDAFRWNSHRTEDTPQALHGEPARVPEALRSMKAVDVQATHWAGEPGSDAGAIAHLGSWFVGEIQKTEKKWFQGTSGNWSADQLEGGAHDFGASYYYWADFNLFYGPSTDIRGDDPDEEFDTGGDGIVEHYKEMKELNDEIARMLKNKVRDRKEIRAVIGKFQTLAKQRKTRTPDDPSNWAMNGGRWVRRSAKGRWTS
ncbi:eCIS core domain-containing protein [Saccharopolyspora shandongensis]|uniref:eCIS core domain-containing protein n=1 Tax=Saccharopolyspora shandongensis TaxID=418495 RepID=UPI0033F6FE94